MIIFKRDFFTDLKLFFTTLIKKRWLDKYGYYYYLSVLEEHKKKDLKKLIRAINNELKSYNFITNLKDDYLVFLSNYGTFGSFEKPNNVYVNIQRTSKEISLTIIHEIVHLILEAEPLFEHLDHEKKEQLVEKRFNELIET